MSLTSVFANATSGLVASARSIQIVSANVANAMTEGYAPRRLDLAAATLDRAGAGVRIVGVTRLVDPVLLGHWRDSGAADAAAARLGAFWQAVEQAVGQPGEGVQAAVSNFASALIAASDRPDLDSRLLGVADSAAGLARSLGAVSDRVQALRAEADAAIARDVAALNDGLARIDRLNTDIVRLRTAGQATAGLEDARQGLISDLSAIVPLREQVRADGRVTLFTASGRLLLDIDPQPIGFAASPAIDAGMTVDAGLSGLTVGGLAVATGANGPFAGGRLAAGFAVRDSLAPQIQQRLDALAAGLIARFQDPATDPGLSPGDPGLFTDHGAALAAAPAPGLAARLAVNPTVLPDSGGALWRIRDGLQAPSPGPVGERAQILRLVSALDRTESLAPGLTARGFSETLADVTAGLSTQRHAAEDAAAQAGARHAELTEQMLAQGVDTDAEMQRLIAIEQAYAANARVIQTADAMLQRLMEI